MIVQRTSIPSTLLPVNHLQKMLTFHHQDSQSRAAPQTRNERTEASLISLNYVHFLYHGQRPTAVFLQLPSTWNTLLAWKSPLLQSHPYHSLGKHSGIPFRSGRILSKGWLLTEILFPIPPIPPPVYLNFFKELSEHMYAVEMLFSEHSF